MIIYMTINLINNKFYIGKDAKNDETYYGSGKILKQAIKKYGKENFIKLVIEECLSEIELCEREIYWIEFYNSIKNGYNIALGGKGGDTITNHPYKDIIAEEHSRKMKLKEYNTRTGKKFGKLSDETKDKIRKKLIGKSWGNHTDASKEKISKKAKGRIVSQETKEKISQAKIGKNWGNHSKETLELLSFLKIGSKNPFYGKKHTDEAKKIISDKNKYPKSEDTKIKLKEALVCYYNKGNKPSNTKKIYIDGEIFLGYTEASIATGLTISQIRNRIKSDKYPNFYHEN